MVAQVRHEAGADATKPAILALPAREAGLWVCAADNGTMHRRHQTVSLMEAARGAPGLARLSELAQDSGARLRQIERLVPMPLRASVRPGPIDGSTWCLLVDHTAAAAKLRQLVPALLADLRVHGWAVETIRLKVQRRD